MTAPLRTLKLTLEYDGTRFVGWERQSNGVSIQSVLEEALLTITREALVAHASGRTDAGVHAQGQVVSVQLRNRMLPIKLRLGLNAVLPEDISVLSVEEMPEGFHARKSATSKHYRYTLVCERARRPLQCRTALHVPQPLDFDAMQRAATALVGRHDFRAFARDADRKRNCVRTILSAGLSRDGTLVHFDITGTGFLYNMVRILTGTLIEVGLGRRREDCIAAILGARSREHAGYTVPPHGLTLMQVHYAERFSRPAASADVATGDVHADQDQRTPSASG